MRLICRYFTYIKRILKSIVKFYAHFTKSIVKFYAHFTKSIVKFYAFFGKSIVKFYALRLNYMKKSDKMKTEVKNVTKKDI